MKARLLKLIGPSLGLVLFSAAVWALHHEIKTYQLKDVYQYLQHLPPARLLTAFLLTVLGYTVMTGYDYLALRYLRQPLSYGKIALASSIGYAFSNNVGLSMIAGATVRLRLYSAWGLSTVQLAKMVAFCTATFGLGFFCLSGLAFLLEPLSLPKSLGLPLVSTRPVGLFLLLVVLVFLVAVLTRRKPFRVGRWEFTLPSPGISAAQLFIAVADWALAGLVLYWLLPDQVHLSFAGFLSIFLLAQLAGMISQIPGGLGVFESLILIMLAPYLPASQALGALLAFRGVYYFLPLMVATLLLGSLELLRQKVALRKAAVMVNRTLTAAMAPLLSLTTFIGGALLIFSGSTPAVSSRLAWLEKTFPLFFVELSHFLGSLAGMGLMLLAKSLLRRLDAAYVLTVVLLGLGIVASLAKGLDYEEALVLGVILFAVLPNRQYFHRKASLFDERLSPGWLAAIGVVMVCSVWLGIFSYRHAEFLGTSWWHFSFSGHAPRFLRAFVGVSCLALLFGLGRLLRPSPPKPRPPAPEEMDKAATIVRISAAASANLALLGDKYFLFNQKGTAFIMFGIEGGSWISMGDPVGPVEEWKDLIWQFRRAADRYAGRMVFYEVGREHLHLYLDMGLSALKIGEEARVPLAGFSLEGRPRKDLRYINRKMESSGSRFEILPAGREADFYDRLKTVSDAWLELKRTREKGFSLGFFEFGYVRRFPVAVVRREGRIEAFATIWQSAAQEELTVDLMRHLPEAPSGVMDYLFIQLMLWGSLEGYRWFNLGMAPLSGLEVQPLAPMWNRIGALIARFGEHFYSFRGLRQYKEKFLPVWEPKYLASPGGLSLPGVLSDLLQLTSGGIRGIISK